MRSSQQQEEFLRRGRFGEGEETIARTKVNRLVWYGLSFLVAACALIHSAVVFGIGRDDGGPFFVMGFIVLGAVGMVLCLRGLVRMRSR